MRRTSAGITGAALAGTPSARAAATTVAVVRNEKSVSGNNVADRVESARMIDRALFLITGRERAQDAWGTLGVRTGDVVGIKINCNRAEYPVFAHPGLVYALCDSLSSIVKANNIIIYERYSNELEQAGFTLNTGTTGVRCLGTDRAGGFDEAADLSRLVTETCTKLVNLPSLKSLSDEFVGTLFLKNHVGSLPPSSMPRCHGNMRMLAEIAAKPAIRGKTVLGLCDGLRGTFEGRSPWFWRGIIAARDIVAAETTAFGVINEQRVAEGQDARPLPSYVTAAAKEFGLGTADRADIELRTATL